MSVRVINKQIICDTPEEQAYIDQHVEIFGEVAIRNTLRVHADKDGEYHTGLRSAQRSSEPVSEPPARRKITDYTSVEPIPLRRVYG